MPTCPAVLACVAASGDELQYTITATNVGDITLTNVDVQDSLVTSALACSITPAGSAISTPASLPFSALARSAVLQCTGSRTVTAADVTARSVTNRATVSADKLTQLNAYDDAESSLLATQVEIL
jgi:hypothetical protein